MRGFLLHMKNTVENGRKTGFRPVEDVVFNRIEHEEHVKAFAHAINPQDLLVIAALSSGITQAELARRLEMSKNRISVRVKQLRAIAISIFGEEAMEGRNLQASRRKERQGIQVEVQEEPLDSGEIYVYI